MHRSLALALTALALAFVTPSCRRETPLARLRRERATAMSSLDLPAARSPRTPALGPHLRVVITANGVDVDSSELCTDPATTAATAVTINAARR